MPYKQIPNIILPLVVITGLETENLIDAVVHYSRGVPCYALQEKMMYVYATEVFNLGGLGNLNIWVEVAPYNVAASFVQLGAAVAVVPTGVTLTVQRAVLPWTAHSEFCRIAVQTSGATAIDFWGVQAVFSGKGV